MAAFTETIGEALQDFIEAQNIFFVASAPLAGGRVNLSPKGMDTFRVLSKREVAYLDLTGSGNETAAHLLENGRITIMFCSFGAKPMILRLYGKGEVLHPGSDRFELLSPLFPAIAGSRQIVAVAIESVQTSCGYAVPRMELVEERQTLEQYAIKKGEAAMADYRHRKNRVSIDGLPTGLPE